MSRRFLPFFGIILLAAVPLLFMWSLVSVPPEGPLKIRLMKVTAVPGDVRYQNPPHELVDLEIENPTKTKVYILTVQLRSEKVSAKVLASPERGHNLFQLDPGKSGKLRLIAYERTKSGIPWEDWEPKIFYTWSEGEKTQRHQLRTKYNQFHHKSPKWLKGLFPPALTAYEANIRNITLPPHSG